MYKIAIIAIVASLTVALFAASIAPATVFAADDKLNCAILSEDVCDAAMTEGGPTTDTGIYKFLVWTLQILTAVVGVVAVGVLIFAGILYSSAGGDSNQVSRAKTMIRDVVIGLVSYGLMFLILNWLIPGGVI